MIETSATAIVRAGVRPGITNTPLRMKSAIRRRHLIMSRIAVIAKLILWVKFGLIAAIGIFPTTATKSVAFMRTLTGVRIVAGSTRIQSASRFRNKRYDYWYQGDLE